MWKVIKSSYILQMPFLMLGSKRLLKLLKYSKKFQQKFELGISNYKEFSGRYIIYENTKVGKEYDSFTHKLLYEGEFLNGERDGCGKEYYCINNIGNDGECLVQKDFEIENQKIYDGKLKFDGVFKLGRKLNGKGYNELGQEIYEINNGNGIYKEFYEKDILKLQVEFKNGYMHGKAKEFYYDGSGLKKIKFEGEYYFGHRWNGTGYHFDNKNNRTKSYSLDKGKGIVQEYYSSNGELKSECEFLAGEKNGKGKEYYVDKSVKFVGKYFCGKKSGFGTKYNDSGEIIFEGEYLYDLKKKGKEYIYGRLEFEGEYLLDKKWNGEGFYKNGNVNYEVNNGNGKVKEYDNYNGTLIFDGEYENGNKSRGKEYYCNGKIKYEGTYLNGKRNGNGLEYEKMNGRLIYLGGFSNGKRSGEGKEYYSNKKIKYEGNYLNGEKHGNGTEYYPNGKIKFKGEYSNGKMMNGKGVDYLPEESTKYEAEYLNGKKWKGFVKEYFGPNNEYLYIGEYVDGCMHGKGKIFIGEEILIFDGEFQKGKKLKGKKYYHNGNLEFEGEFLNGKKLRGKEYNYSGELIFDGEYSDGVMWTGKKKEYFYNGKELKFDGEILKGVRWNGKGKEFDKGKLIFDGKYVEGKQIRN